MRRLAAQSHGDLQRDDAFAREPRSGARDWKRYEQARAWTAVADRFPDATVELDPPSMHRLLAIVLLVGRPPDSPPGSLR